MTPRVPLPGFYCPLQTVCASVQEDGAVQIEAQFHKGKEEGWQSLGSLLTCIQKIAQCLSGMVHTRWPYEGVRGKRSGPTSRHGG